VREKRTLSEGMDRRMGCEKENYIENVMRLVKNRIQNVETGSGRKSKGGKWKRMSNKRYWNWTNVCLCPVCHNNPQIQNGVCVLSKLFVTISMNGKNIDTCDPAETNYPSRNKALPHEQQQAYKYLVFCWLCVQLLRTVKPAPQFHIS